MEFIMQKNKLIPLTLITFTMLSGCSSVPQNSSLAEAHNRFDNARANQQITNLAALELKEAGESLTKADSALNKGESAETVDHLAYIASQQVGIAQETANRKTAELVVNHAAAKRDQDLLAARTAEADAANRQVVIAQATADWQAEELASASANAVSDQILIAQQETQLDELNAKKTKADANTANDQVLIAQQEMQLKELNSKKAKADANAASDHALIAQQEMQLKELNAKKTKRGIVITLGDVLFSSNKAELKSGGSHNVQKLADFLNQFPQHKVLVEGYTDSIGSDNHNLALSERRARAVQTALVDMGINSERVTTRGYGEAFPVASNDTATNRQLNRRVEIILSDENGNIAPR
jgi:outer membrane protein OmpA-like peptidoglycan-associated protein